MTHVSRKKLDNKVLTKILDFLVISLADIKNQEEMSGFLGSFFTETERLMLAKRLGIAYLLSEGLSEDRICEVLSIGKPTVSRIKLWMKTDGKGYEIALKALRKNENFEEFKQVFIDIIYKMTHPYRGILSQMHE